MSHIGINDDGGDVVIRTKLRRRNSSTAVPHYGSTVEGGARLLVRQR